MRRRVKTTINIKRVTTVVVLIRSIYTFVFLCTKSRTTYFRHIIKVYTSDRHDTDLENHTVVIRKIWSAGLYSTAWYSLYFEQYINGYIIKTFIKRVQEYAYYSESLDEFDKSYW